MTTGIPVHRPIGASPVGRDGAHLETLIVGAGPVGLSMALDLARRGLKVTVLSRLDFIAAGSKGICYSKRSLDIWDRLGVGQAMVDRGVVWNLGKVFWGESTTPIYEFDLLPVKDQRRPAFINLQQYHVEAILVDALRAYPNVDIRWGHEVTALDARADGVSVIVEAPGGRYTLNTDWLIACDGNKSTVRGLMGLDFEGRVFEDNFLIADIKMKGEHPAERWFWFDPPFNPGQSALMHKQPDDVWRLDFQLGWNIDREAAMRPENVEPLVRAMLGDEIEFEREWYSVYTFQCRRMQRFVHGRVLFAGDSAHLVSPFGARGANGGLADVDNLGWKLERVLEGKAPESFLESYNHEAITTADENILNSTRSTDFLTPKSTASAAYRDAVLSLAGKHPFARPFVNSGRLSMAVSYPASPLSTPDEDGDWDGVPPGSPALDAPIGEDWLLGKLGGGFRLIANGWKGEAPVPVIDVEGEALIVDRYDLAPGSACLIRPDQYVAARWRHPSPAKISAAIARAEGAAA